ncbi:MAG TPA: carboxymuconolactone decarboxylase family protein [Stellaceae bacterium]|nr:carboxymuconolactone decarboxylase family protein [Stellaceae bacterium]
MRLEIIEQDKMTAAQRELHARIAGARGAVRGPFNLWLYSPELCDRVEALGKFVRFDSSIPPQLRDLAILVTARHWDSSYMWHSYSKRAAEGGIAADVIQAIAERRKPSFSRREDQAVYDYASELLGKHHVAEATFRAAEAAIGKATLVELTALIGNYSMVAMALNAFEVDLPADAKPLPS